MDLNCSEISEYVDSESPENFDVNVMEGIASSQVGKLWVIFSMHEKATCPQIYMSLLFYSNHGMIISFDNKAVERNTWQRTMNKRRYIIMTINRSLLCNSTMQNNCHKGSS